MLKTCKRCGIVDENHICPYKPKKHYSNEARDIRKTNRWTNKSLAIRQRDNYLCRVCRLNKYDTKIRYNSNNLEVHHIVPISIDETKAFDDNNLITLCAYHHELAEKGKIPKEELIKIVEEDIK